MVVMIVVAVLDNEEDRGSTLGRLDNDPSNTQFCHEWPRLWYDSGVRVT